MRKLVTLRKIDNIKPIEGADAIECAVVGGWEIVVKKNQFNIGDIAAYFEIDSFIPHNLAPYLSKGKEPREFNGIKGEKLRTVRLRGQLSQGLLMSVFEIAEIIGAFVTQTGIEYQGKIYTIDEDDLSEILGVKKWEPPVPAQLAGDAKGLFPSFIPKTDEERIQNISRKFENWVTKGYTFIKTEKLDGSSMTCFFRDGEYGVCSRNLELKEDESNTFWKVAIQDGLIDKLKSIGKNIALQGELIGEGIQKNRYAIKGHTFHCFNVFDIDRQQYLSPAEFIAFCNQHSIKTVPIIETEHHLNGTIQSYLKDAEVKSELHSAVDQEGFVYRCYQEQESFKVISNLFLLKGGE